MTLLPGAPQVLRDAVRRFDTWVGSLNETPPNPPYEDSYYLDALILNDSAIDLDDRLMVARVALDDELNHITFIICYYLERAGPVIRHLTLLVDTDYSDIPLTDEA